MKKPSLIIAFCFWSFVNLIANPPNNHDHSRYIEWEGSVKPSIEIRIERCDNFGWIVIYEISNFKFNFDSVSESHVQGEGHAHLFINGTKINRLYGPPYYLNNFNLGGNTVRITLNSNNHSPYTIDGKMIEKTISIFVNNESEGFDNFKEKEWPDEIIPKVKIKVAKDPMKGWNLSFKVKNFSLKDFTNSNQSNYGLLLSINNQPYTKIYGNYHYISQLYTEHNLFKVYITGPDNYIYTDKSVRIMDYTLVTDNSHHDHENHNHDNENKPKLTISRDNQLIFINCSSDILGAGDVLQKADSLKGTWIDVPSNMIRVSEGKSIYKEIINSETKFYRVMRK